MSSSSNEVHDGSTKTLRLGTATSVAEREACYRLRYRVSVEEMGKQLGAADHARKLLTDDFDRLGTIFYVANDAEIVATLRNLWAAQAVPEIHVAHYGLNTLFARVPREQIVFTGHLIIAPEWRQTKAFAYLLEAAYRDGRDKGAWLDFVHCTPALVALYEVMGFRRFKPNIADPDVGLRIPVALVADDVEHLKRTRSPLARFAADYANDSEHGRWFTSTFVEYAQPSCARVMGTDDFLSYLTDHIYMKDHPLLRGLEPDEVDHVVRSGTIIRVREGEAIVRAGDAGSEMYTLLSGAAEVRRTAGNGSFVVLSTLGRGQVFGEMALLRRQPRTADVIAIGDSELLMLDRDFFERLTASKPAVAARVLWNLSITLCERLDMTTGSLLAAVGQRAVS
ncbi:MAG: cyclic nucleotide-binding domain-containing protein [Rhodospirillales bacterium]|nr:cyclic nucleotide-binding domain-containing protein [Rhodospirillales bacterium]